ncbi:hydrolase [Xinfangfangia sp. D13-10-4-6]|uniref:endonuclease/exonuclease/phosphatase family protein n=1 Tax=Pseudogemmobacter hezensis TaxID=2737662 RepID=UPI001555B874|nr:endonuclease/exonuclease/phosphatase family protein [Pseudogemmobacter hezensis]NPD17456.1 hydrolase [Pseudogemmobacter hezensis]
MKLVSYNIQYGQGRDGRIDTGRTAKALIGADIVALQEVDRFWTRSGDRDQLDDIRATLAAAGQPMFTGMGATFDLHKVLIAPDGTETVVRRQFGNAFLSRWPILSLRTWLFPQKLTPLNAHSIQRGVSEAIIDAPGGQLRVYTTHLSHLADDERCDQARFILDLYRTAAVNGPACSGDHVDAGWTEGAELTVPGDAVLLGDLNLCPDDEAYRLLTGPAHPGYGTLLDPSRFADPCRILGQDEADSATLYSDWETRSGIRIDYALVSSGLAARVGDLQVDRASQASDHQPLILTLGAGRR